MRGQRPGFSKCPTYLFVALALFVLYTLFHTSAPAPLSTPAVVLTCDDNIAGRCFENDCTAKFTVDIVYTWVNGSDPRQVEALIREKMKSTNMTKPKCKDDQTPDKDNCINDDATLNRYVDNSELKYSLRSILQYAPWVRKIFIVTNGQIPHWLNISHPRIQLVTHQQIFANKSHLPTFSSPSIEANLHRIPGLSRYWLYFNDDVMLGDDTYPSDFWSPTGGQVVYLSWPIPDCGDGCPSSWIKDGSCDIACNTTECDFDGGDCVGQNITSNNWWWSGNEEKLSPTFCAEGCPSMWLGDKYCDRTCQVQSCGFDAGDCGIDKVYSNLQGYDYDEATLSSDRTWRLNGTQPIYFNFSHVIPVEGGQILEAFHDNGAVIASAVIRQSRKTLVLVFQRSAAGDEKSGGNRTWNVTVTVVFRSSRGANLNLTLTLLYDSPVHGGAGILASKHEKKAEHEGEQVLERVGDSDKSVKRNRDLESEGKGKTRRSHSGDRIDVVKEIERGEKNGESNEQPGWRGKSDSNSHEQYQQHREREEGVVSKEDGASRHYNHNHNNRNHNHNHNRDGHHRIESHWGSHVRVNLHRVWRYLRSFQLVRHLHRAYRNIYEFVLDGFILVFPDFAHMRRDIAKQMYGTEKESKVNIKRTDSTHEESGEDASEVEIEELESTNENHNHERDESENHPRTVIENPNNDMPHLRMSRRGEKAKRILYMQMQLNARDHSNANSLSASSTRAAVRLDSDQSWFERRRDGYVALRTRRFLERMKLASKTQEAVVDDESESLDWTLDLDDTRIDAIDSNENLETESAKEDRGANRHLLDVYGDSLRHVNSLLNQVFGVAGGRKAPAHMPHFIDTNILLAMHEQWPQQFAQTSSNRLRSPKDMQFSFSYFYFYMNQRKRFDFDELWDTEFDRDRDGYLNENELRTAVFKLDKPKDLTNTLKEYSRFVGKWIECLPGRAKKQEIDTEPIPSLLPNASGVIRNENKKRVGTDETLKIESDLVSQPPLSTLSTPPSTATSEDGKKKDWHIASSPTDTSASGSHGLLPPPEVDFEKERFTKEVVRTCDAIYTAIKDKYTKRLKNQFVVMEESDDFVAFKMVKSNYTKTMSVLDELRSAKSKFICLNDNMEHGSENATIKEQSVLCLKALKDFYVSMFPMKSEFELNEEDYHPFTYIDDAPPNYLPQWYHHSHNRDNANADQSHHATHTTHENVARHETGKDDANVPISSGFFTQSFLVKFALHAISVAISLVILGLAVLLIVKGRVFLLGIFGGKYQSSKNLND